MKNLLIVSALITLFMTAIKAQTTTSDIQGIEATINNYFDGLGNHIPASLKKAFHPTATMKFINDDGKYAEVNALEALVGYVESSPVAKMTPQIMSINIAGNVANAQLELEYDTFFYIDMMNMLKIDGEWKIVSKIYSQKNK